MSSECSEQCLGFDLNCAVSFPVAAWMVHRSCAGFLTKERAAGFGTALVEATVCLALQNR